MVWDLRAALLKKQEIESARLIDFAFRERMRTLRLFAAELGLDGDALVRQAVRQRDTAILAALAERPDLPVDLAGLMDRCRVTARAQLIGELGDPTPYRLV